MLNYQRVPQVTSLDFSCIIRDHPHSLDGSWKPQNSSAGWAAWSWDPPEAQCALKPTGMGNSHHQPGVCIFFHHTEWIEPKSRSLRSAMKDMETCQGAFVVSNSLTSEVQRTSLQEISFNFWPRSGVGIPAVCGPWLSVPSTQVLRANHQKQLGA